MKTNLKTALAQKIEAHKLSRRLKKVRKMMNRSTGSPWLDAFADALRCGLTEEQALDDLSKKHDQQDS